MGNVWMLAKANLTKNKSQAATMVLMILLSAMLLNLGFVMLFRVADFYYGRATELNAPHITVITHREDAGLAHDVISGFPQIYVTEVQDVLFSGGSHFISQTADGERIRQGNMIVSRMEAAQQMNPPTFLGSSLPLESNIIYIPHFMLHEGEFAVGDDFVLGFGGIEYDLIVGASTEEIMFGAQLNNMWRVYVSDEMFDTMYNANPQSPFSLVSGRLVDIGYSTALELYFGDNFDGFASVWLLSNTQTARTANPLFVSLIVTVFSFILVIISIFTIRFRIVNNIEEGMTNIGILKAVGYGNHHIILSIVLQFTIIALIGGVLGVLVAQAMFPLVSMLMEPFLGLLWNPTFDIPFMLAAIGIMLVLVPIFSLLSSLRISKLHPLAALRGGTAKLNRSRNPVPLDNSLGNLSFLLALKQLLSTKKQTVTISIIIALLTFASIAGLATHYNLNINQEAYSLLLSGESPDIVVLVSDPDNVQGFISSMNSRDDVRSIFGHTTDFLLTNGEVMSFIITVEHPHLQEAGSLIEGRYPETPYETVVGFTASNRYGWAIGDWVTISDQQEASFEIVGIKQGGSMGGASNGIISGGGRLRINPDFRFTAYSVYLVDGVDMADFASDISSAHGDVISMVNLAREARLASMDLVGFIFGPVAYSMVVATTFVVMLVLYMIIKTTILRRRKELGIHKALGFTTLQLMNQISLSMTPPLIIGVIAGGLAGSVGFNPVFSLITRGGLGIVQPNLPIPVDWMILVCIALVVVAYCVSMLISWNIRRISAYALVSE